MMRFLMFFTPCAVAGYMAYPHINVSQLHNREQPRLTEFNIVLLNTVPKNEIVGSWALSPRSTGIVSQNLGTSGRRSGLSLEGWGGGHANFTVGGRRIEGPIAWSSQAGLGNSPATLHISSANDHFTLRFSKLENDIVLVAEANSVISGEKDVVRFLKTN